MAEKVSIRFRWRVFGEQAHEACSDMGTGFNPLSLESVWRDATGATAVASYTFQSAFAGECLES